jgi:hypothetical protein
MSKGYRNLQVLRVTLLCPWLQQGACHVAMVKTLPLGHSAVRLHDKECTAASAATSVVTYLVIQGGDEIAGHGQVAQSVEILQHAGNNDDVHNVTTVRCWRRWRGTAAAAVVTCKPSRHVSKL